MKKKPATPPAVEMFELRAVLPVAFVPILIEATASMHALAPKMIGSQGDTVSLATAIGICFMRVFAPLTHAAMIAMPKTEPLPGKVDFLQMTLPEFCDHLLEKIGPDFHVADMFGIDNLDDMMKRIGGDAALAAMFPGVKFSFGDDKKKTKSKRGKEALQGLKDAGLVGKPVRGPNNTSYKRVGKPPVTPGASRTRR